MGLFKWELTVGKPDVMLMPDNQRNTLNMEIRQNADPYTYGCWAKFKIKKNFRMKKL